MPYIRTDLDVDHIVELYTGGMSELRIAKQFNASRPAIRQRLIDRGIPIRGPADAYRASRVFHATSRAGLQRGPVAHHESELLTRLRKLGLEARWQEPIGPYNVDIAVIVPRVAVEVQRSSTRYAVRGRSCSMAHKRLEHVLNAGWNLFVVYCPPGHKWRGNSVLPNSLYERFDSGRVYNKLIAFVNAVGWNKASPRQYGMINGYGQPRTIPRVQLDHWPRVPGF